HEIGHDFHVSVIGLDAELRRTFRLPSRFGLPRHGAGFTGDDLAAAYAAWLPEVFADLFGTMMLGAAYITTMIWSFAAPTDPQRVMTVVPVAGPSGPTYEEHPPAHLRVILACRLLSTIGFPGEADQLEAEWRRRHPSPPALIVPTSAGAWLWIDERAFIA